MNTKVTLTDLGFNQNFSQALNNYNKQNNTNYLAARVATVQRDIFTIYTEQGIFKASVSGRYLHVNGFDCQPAVGDWVIYKASIYSDSNAIIYDILPRFSKFSRKVAGNKSTEQIIAANINYLFICISLNNDFNIRRLERYLTMVWNSGATPVVILTKSDLTEDIDNRIEEVKGVAIGVNVHAISSLTGQGIHNLDYYCKQGNTIAFIGSSGVGKSTLINNLAGEELLKTSSIREKDDRGRHTTTHRELILLSNKAVVIDTPGMREFQILGVTDGVSNTFSDIKELAKHCRFKDCQHKTEPHCAVKQAIEIGSLTESRLNNYFKLQKQAAYMAKKERRKLARSNRMNY